MARIFIDGFESGDHDLWDSESNATVISSAGLDMDGDYCLDLIANGEYLQKAITATDELYLAFLYRPTTSGTLGAISFFEGATRLIRFIRNTSKYLDAYVGSSKVDDGAIACTEGTTTLVEIYIKIADSGGRITTKINGVTDIDFTGDTKTGADTQFSLVRLGYDTGSHGLAYYDNLILDDSDWIGNTNIQAVVPTGAGNTTGWTPSAGANWECVDEIPASDADYVSIDAIDTTDTYETGDLAGTIGSVRCVQVQSRALVDGSPTPANFKLVVRSDGTDYLSGDNVVPVAVKSFSYIWEDNPADAAVWEEADVNAMEIGVKSAA